MTPAAGVWCAACLEKADPHRCQAQMYDENPATGKADRPLCLYCADGEPCSVDRVGKPKPPEMYEPERGMPEPAPRLRTDWNGDAPGTHPRRSPQRTAAEVQVSPAVKEAILAYPDGTAFTKIAREEGALEHVVVAIRKNAGFRGAEWRGGRKTSGPETKAETKVIGGEEVRMTPGVVMGPELLGPERNDPMKDLELEILKYAGKMSDSDVGDKVGCSPQRVQQIRKKHNVRPWKGRPPIDAAERAKILADAQTANLRDVAKKHDVAVGTVAAIVKESGQPRPDRRGKWDRTKHAALIKPGQRTIEINVAETPAAQKLIDAPAAPVEMVEVRLRMSVIDARQQLAALTARELEIALQAVHDARMRG